MEGDTAYVKVYAGIPPRGLAVHTGPIESLTDDGHDKRR